MPRMIFKDMAEVAQHLEAKALSEEHWAESARKTSDKDRCTIRAATFREVAAMLESSQIG